MQQYGYFRVRYRLQHRQAFPQPQLGTPQRLHLRHPFRPDRQGVDRHHVFLGHLWPAYSNHTIPGFSRRLLRQRIQSYIQLMPERRYAGRIRNISVPFQIGFKRIHDLGSLPTAEHREHLFHHRKPAGQILDGDGQRIVPFWKGPEKLLPIQRKRQPPVTAVQPKWISGNTGRCVLAR